MSVWSVWGDEVWYSGWRAENYLSCITARVGLQDLEVKRHFNVQFFSRWSIDSCWTWRSLSLPSRSAFHIPARSTFCFRIEAPAAFDLDDSGSFPTQGSLQLSRALPSPPTHTQPSPTHFASPVILTPYPSPLTPSLLLPGPCLGH